MNNYVLSEADDQATGKGQVHLGSEHHPYLFLHKVAGQREIIEYIVQPITHGFHKRFPHTLMATSQIHQSVAGRRGSFFSTGR